MADTDKKLLTNVLVHEKGPNGETLPGGKWYGPDFLDAGDPPSGSVTNPAAFVAQSFVEPPDNRQTAGDFEVEVNDDLHGKQRAKSDAVAPTSVVGPRLPALPEGYDKEPVETLRAYIVARGGTPPPSNAKKDDYLDVLRSTA